MVVRKIIETTLTAGSTTVTFTDSDIPNSLIRTYCTDSDLYPVSLSLSGTTLTITYEAQSSNKGIALEIVKEGLQVIDNLTSTDTDNALSANQGKVLKDTIDGLTAPALADLTDVDFVSLTEGDIIVYDSVNEKFVNQSMPSIPSDITDLDDVDITAIQDGQVLAWDNNTSKFKNVTPSSGSDIYSDTETEIGTFLNNTLYRRVFDLGSDTNIPNNNWYTSNISVTGLSFIIKCFGVNTSGTFYPLNAYHSSGNVNLLACRDGAVANCRYISIDYTKNT